MDNENMISNEELEEVAGGKSAQRYVQYVVVKGDNLTRIAKKFKTTIAAIMKKNPIITDKNLIRVGWVLTVPDNRA